MSGCHPGSAKPSASLIAAVALTTILGPVHAQSPATSKFEVATVKLNTSGNFGTLISGPTPERFTTRNAPLSQIIMYAFGVRADQVVAPPPWTQSQRFDIVAKYPDGPRPTPQQVALMVKELLADRFKLQTHQETRELPLYRLMLVRRDGRLGPKLKPVEFDCAAYLAEKGPVAAVAVGDAPLCAPMIVSGQFIKASVKPLASLTFALATRVGRAVVDTTGLSGNFDFNLEWSPDSSAAAPAGDAASRSPSLDERPSLFTALEEQLGLRLESSKGPVDVLVIDHVERPAED
jgi:uncharacterized protein (TIGR03435 family)